MAHGTNQGRGAGKMIILPNNIKPPAPAYILRGRMMTAYGKQYSRILPPHPINQNDPRLVKNKKISLVQALEANAALLNFIDTVTDAIETGLDNNAPDEHFRNIVTQSRHLVKDIEKMIDEMFEKAT